MKPLLLMSTFSFTTSRNKRPHSRAKTTQDGRLISVLQAIRRWPAGSRLDQGYGTVPVDHWPLDGLILSPFMASRRIEVFFYGLFMDADLLRKKGVNPTNIRPASVSGFALRIGQRATLLRNPNGLAHGILMELTHAEIEQLYSDPSVRAYRPEAVLCDLKDGSLISALCFNLLEPPRPEEANPEYAAKLRELAARLGFPSDYVDSIH